MKANKILAETTDSLTYKLAFRTKELLACPLCGPNKGCNRRRKQMQRNWKKFRKTKFKLKRKQQRHSE